jgi:hypothetical protein
MPAFPVLWVSDDDQKIFLGIVNGVLFIFLIAFGLISIRLSLNQKEQYLELIIVSLVILAAIFVVSLTTTNRKINVPIRWLQDATQSVGTDLSQLTQVATGLANGDLSQTAQIQTRPLEINTKDGNSLVLLELF